jgi:hypothetical protein
LKVRRIGAFKKLKKNQINPVSIPNYHYYGSQKCIYNDVPIFPLESLLCPLVLHKHIIPSQMFKSTKKEGMGIYYDDVMGGKQPKRIGIHDDDVMC